MDTVTMIRVVAGVLAVIILGVIIARRKRMSSSKPNVQEIAWRARPSPYGIKRKIPYWVSGSGLRKRVSVAWSGLLRDKCLEPGAGLLIFPSQAIHTVAMRFPIDVIFVDRQWRVVHVRPEMVPFRMTVLLGARCVIELPVGTIAKTSTAVGDQLCVT